MSYLYYRIKVSVKSKYVPFNMVATSPIKLLCELICAISVKYTQDFENLYCLHFKIIIYLDMPYLDILG